MPVKSNTSRLSDTLRQQIVFDGTSSPVKTALFVIICLAWTLPGLIGHDPWKPEEAIAFGTIYDLLSGGDWLVPGIAGVPYLESPPFFTWIGAIFASIFSPLLSLHDGARLTSAMFLAITMVCTALAAIRLFDERAARICVLMLIGSLGLLLRAHEITPQLAPFAGMSIALYGLVRIQKDARNGSILMGIGSGLTGLSGGIVPALLLFIIPIVLASWQRDWLKRETLNALGHALLIAIPCAFFWPALLLLRGDLPASAWLAAATGVHALSPGGRPFEATYFIHLLTWYALPALPVALWVWWRDRKLLRERFELALPLVSFVVLLLGFSLFREARDDMALPLLLPLILAAAHGIDRLPRGLASFVDWFGMVTFFLFATLLWTGWTAAHTGAPPAAARWVARQAPGYEHQISWLLFGLALALTFIWLFAVFRTRRTNRRAIVNWAAGITLIWMLGNLLWLPAIDHVRSYRSTAAAIKAALPAERQCVAQIGLGDAQRAAFDYHAGLRFIPATDASHIHCDTLIVQGARDREPVLGPAWSLLWQGARPGDNFEHFRLYRKSG